MALVPNGLANAAGAVLNQAPVGVVSPFTQPTPLPDFPSELVIPVIQPIVDPVPPAGAPNRRFAIQITIEVDTSVYNPATSLSGIGVRMSESVPQGQPGPPFDPLTDIDLQFPFAPPAPGSTAKTLTLSGICSVPPAEGKSLYLSVFRVAGDTADYDVLPPLDITFQRL